MAGRAGVDRPPERASPPGHRQLATTDELTQLANRRQFDEALAAEVVRAERFGTRSPSSPPTWTTSRRSTTASGTTWATSSCAHSPPPSARMSATSTCPRGTAARSSPCCFRRRTPRADDSSPSDCGGQEELSLDSGGAGTVPVRSSFGVASYPAERSAAALMRAADRALYRAKAAGKNQVVVAERKAASAQ